MWCKSCMEIRDREVMHCMVRIRLATGLELTTRETERLVQSYFERRYDNGKNTLEEIK